jgi:hypothetical protein
MFLDLEISICLSDGLFDLIHGFIKMMGWNRGMFFRAGSMIVPDAFQHLFQVDVVLRMSSEPLPWDGRWTRDGSPRCQAGVDDACFTDASKGLDEQRRCKPACPMESAMFFIRCSVRSSFMA